MSNRKQRHLSPAGFLLALALLIVGIFAADYVYRLFFRSSTENIIGTGGFSTTSSSSGTASEDGENATDSTEETQPSGIVLQLTAADQASGPLVLADASHPYTGTSVWSDFSAVTDANVKTRSTSLQVQPEIIQPICELFDAYAAANGYANLQIYSTLDGTLDSTSIYTNILPDRSTGYGFDIGLITSTGEVVPYITKCNEWMVANSWQYGFVLRYPSDKTDTTGTAYAPHHFRYVGKIHAAFMHENNFTLEEYLNYLQNYPVESGGLSYSDGTQSYSIYYVPADASGTTKVTLPENTVYTISGDNRGGFVLTITNGAASGDTGAAETTAAETTAAY